MLSGLEDVDSSLEETGSPIVGDFSFRKDVFIHELENIGRSGFDQNFSEVLVSRRAVSFPDEIAEGIR